MRTLLSLALGSLVWAMLLGAAPPQPAGPAPQNHPLAVPAGYLIHANDQLNVQVFGEDKLSQTVTVLPNGEIDYPLVGRIRVGGQTPEQAAATIARSMQKYLRHPMVTVSVAQQGQLNVLVLGNVKNPGKFPLAPSGRVSDAIAAAGGLGPTNGDLPDARISTQAGSVQQVALQKLFRGGDTTQDLHLEDGAVVYIPAPAQFNVEVLGSVDHPGEITLNEGDRLSIAVAKAGNSANSNADLNHVRVTRTLTSGQTQTFSVNLYEKLERGDLASDVVMQKGDVVYIPQAKRGSGLGGAALSVLLSLRHLIGLP